MRCSSVAARPRSAGKRKRERQRRRCDRARMTGTSRSQMASDRDPRRDDADRGADQDELARRAYATSMRHRRSSCTHGSASSRRGQSVARAISEQVRPRKRRADHSVEQPFADERQANVRVGRADQLHDRDLAAAREDGQANRVGNDDSGDGQEDDDDADADATQNRAELQQALRRSVWP